MERLSLLFLLLVAALWYNGCLCFPKNKEPDPSTRIGGPSDIKPLIKGPKRGYRVKLVAIPPKSNAEKKITGELLAVDTAHLWIQTKDKRYKIPREKIAKMTIVGLSAQGTPAPSEELEVGLNYMDYAAKYARHPGGMPPDKAPAPKVEPEPAPEKAAAPPTPPAPPAPKPDSEKCGAFILEGTRLLWGMGVVDDVRDPVLARKLADARARKQIALLIQHHLHLDVPLDIVLQHAEIAERWQIPEKNARYSIAVVELAQCGLLPEQAEKLWDGLKKKGLDAF